VAAVASGEPVAGVKVPSKLLLPSRIETEPETEELPWFTTARSATPSAFKSPVAMATGAVPTAIGRIGSLGKSDIQVRINRTQQDGDVVRPLIYHGEVHFGAVIDGVDLIPEIRADHRGPERLPKSWSYWST